MQSIPDTPKLKPKNSEKNSSPETSFYKVVSKLIKSKYKSKKHSIIKGYCKEMGVKESFSNGLIPKPTIDKLGMTHFEGLMKMIDCDEFQMEYDLGYDDGF